MNYTPRYSQSGNFVGVTTDTGMSIPADLGNSDFKTFMAWYAQQSPAPFSIVSGAWSDKPARIFRPRAAILSDIQALAAGPQAQLFNAIRAEMAVDFLIAHPNFAASLGINIAGDQPNP